MSKHGSVVEILMNHHRSRTAMNAGSRNDILIGGPRDDDLRGGGGNDVLVGRNGNDQLFGGSGHDYLDGGDGNDEILAGSGNDALFGAAGSDLLDGGNGDDVVDAGSGNDKLAGGAGNDRLDGGKGDDLIIAGPGNDHIEGGSGRDVVEYAGSFSEYKVQVKNFTVEIQGKNGRAAEGRDTLQSIEFVRFAGELYRVSHNKLELVDATNHPPIVTPGSLEVREDASATSLGVSAPTDVDSNVLTIIVTGLPAKGTVYLADGVTAVVNGQTLSSTQLTGLLFAPAANSNGDAGLFSYTVSDGIAAPVNGSVAIAITPLNDIPIVASGTLTINEDAGVSPLGLLAPTDVDGDALMVTVTGLPAKGTVYLSDGVTAIANGAVLSIAQLTGLMFAPLTNANGDAGLFSFKVSDGISAPVIGSMAITITPLNDTPVVASGTLIVAEDAAAAPLGLSAPTDVDGDALTITVTGLPAKGTVYLADGVTTVVNGQILDSAQLTGLRFAPAANANGDAGLFSYAVFDGIAAPVSGSVTITITLQADEELTVPIISEIKDDTGVPGDGITSDQTLTVSGTGTPGSLIVVFLDQQEIGSTTVSASGAWTFDYSTISLSEKSYVFSAEARLGGKTSGRSDGFEIEVDTTAPTVTSLGLAPSSDTGVVGDLITEAANVTIVGQAEARTTIELVGTNLKTIADVNGEFSFPGIDLPVGTSELTLRVVDAAGNENRASLTLERLAASGAENAALGWNQITLDAIRSDASTPIVASRTLAMESIAVLDVLAAVDGTPAIMVGLTAPENLSVDAAVAAAAHRVLTYLYPAQAVALDQKLATDLADITEGSDKEAGLSFGRAIADAVIALRDHDGWDAFVSYNTDGAPGQWVPTSPMFDVPLAPHWGALTPFALQTGDQFRPGASPSLDSAEYAAAFEEVRRLGSATSDERTAEQTQIARFWADGAGSFTPSGHWNAIATEAARAEGFSLSASARMLAMLNIGLADAGIAGWDAKYQYGTWRPITAIRRADEDGNASTTVDPTWQPLLITPAFPEYPSGHSTYSATAATILTDIFGDYAFSTSSIGLPGVTRSFDSFEDAASEAGQSRIYGGIHFQFANIAGQATGRLIGNWVLDAFSGEADTRAPVVLIDQKGGSVTAGVLTLTGFALDNLAGLASLQVKFDGGEAKSVAVDEAGRFSLDVDSVFAGFADGQHTLAFTAEDAAGNANDSTYIFTRDTAAPVIELTDLAAGEELTSAKRLAGTVSGTGSEIVSLGYRFDDGSVRPINFDKATGVFDEPFYLAMLGIGSHQLQLVAKDQGGNTTEIAVAVNFSTPVPFAVASITPANGAGDIGVTFRPQVTFTRPYDPLTLTEQTFFATDAQGNVLSSTIVMSPDHTRAWLFFDQPMPGASTVKLHIDGDVVKAAGDSAALDGDGDAVAGGDLLTSFSTVSQTAIPNTTIVGKVVGPGADFKPMTYDDFRAGPDGAAHTSDDVFLEPIAGAKIFILGLENQAVFTNAQGNFTLTNVPSGVVKVAIDGRTATNPPAGVFYPEMVMDVSIRPGVVNTMMGTMGQTEEQVENLNRPEVYLPRLSSDILQALSDTTPTVITAGAEAGLNLTEAQREKLQIIVQPGSAIGENGQPVANAQVGIQMVDPALVRDMLPPGIMQLAATFTIQAPGVAAFSEPVAMSFPNLYDLAPGEKTFFYSFNHTTGLLEISGTATASEDGLSVVTDPGQGITAPGWFGPTTPGSPSNGPDRPPNDDECEIDWSKDATSNVGDIIAWGVKCLADFGGVSKWLELAAELLEFIQDARDLGEEIQEAQQSGAPPSALLVLAEVAALTCNRIETLVEALQQSNPLTRLEAGIECAESALAKAEAICDRLNDSMPEECDSPTFDIACFSLGFLGSAIGGVRTIVENVNKTTTQIISNSVCFLIEKTIEAIKANSQEPPDSEPEIPIPIATLSLGEVGIAVVSELDELLQQWITEADAQILNLDSLNALQMPSDEVISASSAAYDAFARFSAMALGYPPNAHFLVSFDDQVIRGRTDAQGEVSVFLPPETAFILEIFDPASDRYGAASGISARSGQTTSLPAILLGSSFPELDRDSDGTPDAADEDGDGLIDAVERVVGTSIGKPDSDGDGISDYAEVQAGSSPLDGIAVATGVLASASVRGEVRGITAEGGAATANSASTAFIATGSFGLVAVDVTDAFALVVRAELDLPGTSVDVAIDSSLNIAAVASGAGGLHLVDVSDTTAPTLIETIAVGSTQVEIIDGAAYVNDGGTLKSFDLTTGDEIQTLDLFGAGTSVTGLAREGAFLYALDNNNAVHAIEVINGLLMVERGSFTLPLGLGGVDRQLFVAEGVLYVPAGASYATINVANPAAMSLISGPDANNIVGTAIALNGSGLGIAVGSIAGNAIDIVRTDDPANTGDFVTRITLPTAPSSVAVANGLAFVGAGNQLQVVNYLAFDTAGQAPGVTLIDTLADIDAATPGIQVQEGQVVPFGVRVIDDVQVRDVELLVNGVVQRTDGSYPFDLRAALPTIAANGSDTLTLQVRATDTGGNFGLSELVTVQLVPDIVGPTIVQDNVPDGGVVGQSFRAVRFTFSEPIDESVANATNFRLIGPGGDAIEPTEIQVKSNGLVVQLTYPSLALGPHRFEIDAAAVTDRAGNALGAAPQVLTQTFDVAQFSIEWVSEIGGNANAPANWSGNRVPTVVDDAFIDLPVGQTVTFNTAGAEYGSLTSTGAALQQTAGSLHIDGGLETSGHLQVSGGTLTIGGNGNVASLRQSGGFLSSDGTLTVTGLSELSGGTQSGPGTTVAQGGATLSSTSFALDGGRTLELDAASTVVGAVQLNLNGSNPQVGGSAAGSGTLLIANGATLDDRTSDSGLYVYANNFGPADNGAAAAVVNGGTFIKSGPATTSTIATTFNNHGVVDVRSGTLVLAGGGADVGAVYQGNGTINFSNGTRTLDATSSLTTNTLFSGGVTTINGSYASSSMRMSNGAVMFADAATTGSLVQTGGFISGPDVLTVTGLSELSGGTQSGPGTTVAQGGATLSSTSFALDGGRTLELDAASTVVGAVQLNLNGSNPQVGGSAAGSGTLLIANGATLDDRTSDSGLYVYANNFGPADNGAAAAVVNGGTFIKSGPATTSTIATTFNNHGVVDVRSGTLVLAGGGADVGAVYQGNGTINFSNGTRTLDATSSLTTNTLFSGGVTTINGSYASSSMRMSNGAVMFADAATTGSLVQTGGFISGPDVLTVTGLSELSGGTQSGPGTTVAQGGATLSSTSFALDGGRTLELDAASTVVGAVQLNLNGSNPQVGGSAAGSGTLLIANGATLDDRTSDSGLYVYANNFGPADNGAAAAVVNGGTFIKSGPATTSTIATTFNNHGVVDVRSGTLVLAGGGADVGAVYQGNGTINFSNGTRTLDATSSLTTNTLFSGGVTTINGSYASSSMRMSNGAVMFADAATTGSLVQTGGFISGPDVLTVTGLSELSGGTQSGPGTTVAQGGATLSSTSFALDGGRTLELDAASTVVGAVQLNLNGSNPQVGGSAAGSGTLLIANGATLDDRTSDSGLYVYANNFGPADNGAAAAVVNDGTFIKSGPATTSTIAVDFINSGLLVAESGLLRFTEPVDNSGGVIQTQGGNLEFRTLVGGTVSVDDSIVHVLSTPQDFTIDFSSDAAGTIQFEAQQVFVAPGLAISGWGVGDQLIVPQVDQSGPGGVGNQYVPNASGTGGTLYLTYGVFVSGQAGGSINTEIEIVGNYTADNFVFSNQGDYTVITLDPATIAGGQQAAAAEAVAESFEFSSENGSVLPASGGMETGFIFKPDAAFSGPPAGTTSNDLAVPSAAAAALGLGADQFLAPANESFQFDASTEVLNVQPIEPDQSAGKSLNGLPSNDWWII